MAERRQLEQNFFSLTNTTIISPRRWGKSSLVKRVAKDCAAKEKRLKVCIVDLFNVRSEADFYQQLTAAVIKASSIKWEEWLSLAKQFLAHLRPQISLAGDGQQEISFDVEWARIVKDADELLDLPEKIALAKKTNIIICIDEFQSIGEFKDSLAFQRKLRAHWQNHQQVGYCLYGSKRHMLMDIFSNPSMPFYRFGDIMFLQKISNQDWGVFISERFADTGKIISLELAHLLAGMVENHPYYVQQLAQQAWLRTGTVCDAGIIDAAMTALKDQLSLLFAGMADAMTARQLGLLHALIDGVGHLSSTDTLKAYRLGTSANVVRLKAALVEKEIIDSSGGSLVILDPVFKYWLKKDYFGV